MQRGQLEPGAGTPASKFSDPQGRYTTILRIIDAEKPTARQLLGRLAAGGGHCTMVGTPEQIANEIELWFSSGAGDGFNLMPPLLPESLDEYADLVIPVLQQGVSSAAATPPAPCADTWDWRPAAHRQCPTQQFGTNSTQVISGCKGGQVNADINFYFDPVCPFAWMTSKWVRQVQAQREYSVDWRFISLRLINADVDYDAHFPPEYEAGHTAGLRLLRVAARARAEHGRESIARLYKAFGTHIFEAGPETGLDTDNPSTDAEARERRGTREFVEPILAEAGLPLALAEALDDESWDRGIRQETDEALGLTGKDVGTPIIHFEPPAGVAFFGPVISRLPDDDSAAELWDHVVGLARFPGFAELKRSLREQPQLPAFGVSADEVGRQEDWHGGSRRQKK